MKKIIEIIELSIEIIELLNLNSISIKIEKKTKIKIKKAEQERFFFITKVKVLDDNIIEETFLINIENLDSKHIKEKLKKMIYF